MNPKHQETVASLHRYGVTWTASVVGTELLVEFEVPADAHEETVFALIRDCLAILNDAHKSVGGSGLVVNRVEPSNFPLAGYSST